MALEKTFRELVEALKKLSDCVLALQLTTREDAPASGGVALTDGLADAVDDARGWLEESMTAAVAAQEAVCGSIDFDRVRTELSRCQEKFHNVQQTLLSKLLSYEQLRHLTAFGRSRRGEWQAWVKSVKCGLEQCREPMDGANKALVACWEELADRAGRASITVRAASVGQQPT